MQLKHGSVKSGECRVSTCSHPALAVADGRTFFSKRAPAEIELCEEHLFKAQEMATTQGEDLIWREGLIEVSAPAADAPAAAPAPAAPAPAPAPAPASAAVAVVVEKELAQETTKAEAALFQIEAFEIGTKDDLDFAAEVLTETKQSWKRIEEKRKEITAPLNEALRAVNALFKPALGFYEKCERLIKGKMTDAHAKSETAARQALEAAGAAAAAGDAEGLSDALAGHDAAVLFPQADGIQYRSSWKFEIIDESKIPREFMTPNLRMIQGVVLQQKSAAEIPGVRVFEEKIVASVGTTLPS
jgi:hypothetical protein